MKKNDYVYEKNMKKVMPIVPMNYIGGSSKGIGGGMQSPNSHHIISDIYIFKIPVNKLETGYLAITPPENFELLDISYSANEIDNHVARQIFAIYTFIRKKNNLKKMEI